MERVLAGCLLFVRLAVGVWLAGLKAVVVVQVAPVAPVVLVAVAAALAAHVLGEGGLVIMYPQPEVGVCRMVAARVAWGMEVVVGPFAAPVAADYVCLR